MSASTASAVQVAHVIRLVDEADPESFRPVAWVSYRIVSNFGFSFQRTDSFVQIFSGGASVLRGNIDGVHARAAELRFWCAQWLAALIAWRAIERDSVVQYLVVVLFSYAG